MASKTSRHDGAPSFPWYPNDWESDTGVQTVSLAARGLWIELLNLMWKAPVRGTLSMVDGKGKIKQIEAKTLAKKVGTSEQEVQQTLSELEANGVYSTLEDGTIYNRRMYRTAQANLKRAESGRLGGLKAKSKQKDLPSSSSSSSEDTNVSSSPLPPEGERPVKEDRFKNLKTELQTAWNDLADIHGLPRVEAWNETRAKSLRARAAHPFWRDNWREALSRVPLNAWYLGENDRGWRANIDWFLRDKTVPQLIERTATPKQQDYSDPEIVAKYGNKVKSQ